METFQALSARIIALPSKHRQKIVAIDGGSGAGKSTFAHHLSLRIPHSAVIHIDSFYIGEWNRRVEHRNYNIHPLFDWDRFEREVIEPLQKGKHIVYHVYDWHLHNTDNVAHIDDESIIILEGVQSFQPRFAEAYDYRIWLEAPEHNRLEKGLARDGEQMEELWLEDWLPIERNYMRTHEPIKRADLVVLGHNVNFSEGTFETLD
jgi:uridine kinase